VKGAATRAKMTVWKRLHRGKFLQKKCLVHAMRIAPLLYLCPAFFKRPGGRFYSGHDWFHFWLQLGEVRRIAQYKLLNSNKIKS